MSAFVILILLLLGNWLLFDFLLFIPFNLFSKIGSLSWCIFAVSALVFLGWCFGEDRS